MNHPTVQPAAPAPAPVPVPAPAPVPPAAHVPPACPDAVARLREIRAAAERLARNPDDVGALQAMVA